MQPASFWRQADGVVLQTPYNEEYIEVLKRLIPSRGRRWNPEDRTWWIANRWVLKALEIVRLYYDLSDTTPDDDEDEETFEPDRPKLNPALEQAWRTLFLLPDAPAELVVAAYRTLAKLYHPDRGGTTLQMQALNWAYDLLKPK